MLKTNLTLTPLHNHRCMTLEFNAVLTIFAVRLWKLKQMNRIMHLPMFLRRQAISFPYLVKMAHMSQLK